MKFLDKYLFSNILQYVLILLLINTQDARAQVRSSGKIFIHKKTEVSIHRMPLLMKSLSTGNLAGIIGTERNGKKGFLSFNALGLIIGGSDSAYIDGYAKSYLPVPQLLPIGDNGRYRPIKLGASKPQPADAAFYRANPSIGVTSSIKGGNEPVLPISGPYNVILKDNLLVDKIDTTGYWDINGNEPTQISLSWNKENQLASFLNSDLYNLLIVGWDGSKWVKINSSIDNTSIFGGASTFDNGSITTIGIIPNNYDVYALAKRIIPKDTMITPVGGGVITIGPRYSLDSNTIYSISGPFHQTGTATVDNSGVVLYTPNPNAPIGIDTIYRIRIETNGSSIYRDTFRIYIRIPLIISDTMMITKMNTEISTSLLARDILEGNLLTFSYYGSLYGNTTPLNSQGNILYKPNSNYIGIDTIYRVSRVVYTNGTTLLDTSLVIILTTPNIPDTSFALSNDTTIIIGPMLNFSNGVVLTSSSVNASRGTAILNLDGSISYTPYSGASGIDTIIRIICVTIQGQFYCDTSLIFIMLSSELKIANYISPNGDGSNDVWILPKILFVDYPNLKVIIYNRWGNIVWRSEGTYQNDWAGVNIDKDELPDGVYYYLVELNSNNEKNLTGFIEVMRR